MKGHLTMSQKERQRMLVLDRVVNGELRLSEAAVTLQMSYRHAQRLLVRYRDGGEAALVHGLRGREGTHRCDASTKEQVLETYREQYPDFGPTFASEKLSERNGLVVQPETLRLWLIEAGFWMPKKRRYRHRSRRKRRARFGELVQLDGSHHDWFEGRGPKCCLITMVDDATGRTYLWFSSDEGVFAVMAAIEGWIRLYGIPLALYTDWLKTYLTSREPTVAEQLAGQEPLTQVGRACSTVGVRIIGAGSAQAKGRVERKHGLTQDRLVKELRLAGINTIEEANEFVKGWLPGINERYSVEAADTADAHRPVPDNLDLEAVFSRHEERVIGNDWVVRYKNRYLQIVKQPDLPPSRSAVVVRERSEGQIQLAYRDRLLQFTVVSSRPERVVPPKEATAPVRPTKPAAEHPWRRMDKQRRDTNPRMEVIEQVAERYLGETYLPGAARSCMRNVTFGGEL